MKNLYHTVNLIPPVSNAFGGVVVTPPINMKNWGHVSFLLHGGVGAVGTAQVTIEACSDTVPTSTTPIGFFYQECINADTFGPITQAPITGLTTSAANNKIYKIEVDGLFLASTGFGYVRLKSNETVVGSIVGSITAVLTEGRFVSEIPTSVLV